MFILSIYTLILFCLFMIVFAREIFFPFNLIGYFLLQYQYWFFQIMYELRLFEENFIIQFCDKYKKKYNTAIDLKIYQQQRALQYIDFLQNNYQKSDILTMSPKEFYQYMTLLYQWKKCLSHRLLIWQFNMFILMFQQTYLDRYIKQYHQYMLENPQNQKCSLFKLRCRYEYLQQIKNQSLQMKHGYKQSPQKRHGQKQSAPQKHGQKQSAPQKHGFLYSVMKFFGKGNSEKVNHKQSVREADLTIKLLQQHQQNN